MTDNQTKQRDLLKAYLDQYGRMGRRVEALEWRLKAARDALSCASIRSGLSNGMTPCGGGVSAGAAAPILKEESLSERLMRMRDERARIMTEVMDIISLLPDSDEREVLEYRHMDGMRWREIGERMRMSRSPCFQCYKRGLDQLLTFQRVRDVLADFEARRNRGEQ
ncbi:MAG: hypothetical protein IKO14_02925 [Oscillibacter sp.]|nr:hypothetical protein [Oscillibacter sp.]